MPFYVIYNGTILPGNLDILITKMQSVTTYMARVLGYNRMVLVTNILNIESAQNNDTYTQKHVQ